MDMFKLRDQIAVVAPTVTCLSIGKDNDKSTWKVNYSVQPSADVLAQVQAVINAYTTLTAEQSQTNLTSRAFLDSTDWQVLRQQDQVALGMETSLTEEEYIALLEQRQAARDAIVQEGA